MKEVREMYEYNEFGFKYLLVINDDGSLNITEYNKKGEPRELFNCEITDCGKNGGKRVEYALKDGGCKSSLPFKNYEDGELNKRWTKIK
jgi:hypothetical protein